MTVYAALKILKDADLVNGVPGRGRFVRANREWAEIR